MNIQLRRCVSCGDTDGLEDDLRECGRCIDGRDEVRLIDDGRHVRLCRLSDARCDFQDYNGHCLSLAVLEDDKTQRCQQHAGTEQLLDLHALVYERQASEIMMMLASPNWRLELTNAQRLALESGCIALRAQASALRITATASVDLGKRTYEYAYRARKAAEADKP